MRSAKGFLALLLIVVLLSACQGAGSSSTPRPASPDGSETAVETSPSPSRTPRPSATPVPSPTTLVLDEQKLRGMEILFLHPLSGEAEDRLDEQVAAFNRENQWGIKVEIYGSGSDNALESDLAEGAGTYAAEVALAPSSLIQALAQAGQVTGLQRWLSHPEYGLDTAPWHPDWLAQDEFEGEQLAIPALRTLHGVMFNRSASRDLGYGSLPRKPEDFFRQACSSAERNNQNPRLAGSGGWLQSDAPLTALGWLRAYDEEFTWGPAPEDWQFATPANRATFRDFHRQQASGCVWLPRYPLSSLHLESGMAFAYNASLQDLLLLRGTLAAAGLSASWELIPFPSVSGEPFFLVDGYSYALIPSAEAGLEGELAGWLFLRWLSAPERLEALSESWPSLSVRKGEVQVIPAVYRDYVDLEDARLLAAPADPAWYAARGYLADAFWQLFRSIDVAQVDAILPALDEILAEQGSP